MNVCIVVAPGVGEHHSLCRGQELLAASEDALMKLVEVIHDYGEESGLELSMDKTKTSMVHKEPGKHARFQ